MQTAQIKEINCVGLPVRHKTFGAGIVEDVEKTRIIIEFETKGQKTLQHPRSIIDGLLQFEDAAIKDRFGQNDRIRKEIDELKGQRKKAEEEIYQQNTESLINQSSRELSQTQAKPGAQERIQPKQYMKRD